MSGVPSKFDHDHNSLSILPMFCRPPSPSIRICLETPIQQRHENDAEECSCDGTNAIKTQDSGKDSQRTEYDQIFEDLVHSEESNDGQQAKTKKKHNQPELNIDEDVDKLARVFEMELTAATPMSANGQPSCPSWALEGPGFQTASSKVVDLNHPCCDATDCGHCTSNPPTPGEYVFTPLPDDSPSPTAPIHDSPPPPISTPTHLTSPISVLELDFPEESWRAPNPPDHRDKSPNAGLDPIFTRFDDGGLPSPDDTPTEADNLISLFPLLEARYEAPNPEPTTPPTKRSRTDSCITDAPRKRSRGEDLDGEVSAKRRRRS